MFGEAFYETAYQRGLSWADEVFHGWVASGRPVPRELPLSKEQAATLVEQAFMDTERQARVASVLYATACVRWRRLVSNERDRRAG